MKFLRRLMASLLMISALTACGGGTGTPMGDAGRGDAGSRPTMSMATRTMLTGNRMGMPPAGAMSMGMMSMPQVTNSNINVPVMNTEVFVFQADVFGTGQSVQVFYAYDATTMKTYFWASAMGLACANGMGTGNAFFFMMVNADGTGAYLVGAEGCGQAATGGCEFNSSQVETTCGACALSGNNLACVAAGT